MVKILGGQKRLPSYILPALENPQDLEVPSLSPFRLAHVESQIKETEFFRWIPAFVTACSTFFLNMF